MEPEPRFRIGELLDRTGLNPGRTPLAHPFAAFDIHWPEFLKSLARDAAPVVKDQMTREVMQKVRPVEEAMQQGFRGFGKYLSKFPVGNALNALDFAPIPESLIQRMLQQGQPPTT